MSKLKLFIVLTISGYVVFFVIIAFTIPGGAKFNIRELLLMLALTPAASLIGVYIHSNGASFLTGIFTGQSFGLTKPSPLLSKARVHIQREEWTEARAELETQWIAFPGNGEVLREFDRLFMDGMKAPSGLAAFYRKALSQLGGKDRAFAYMRLAELNIDHLDDRGEAHMWCSRLLTEFPSSEYTETAQGIAAQTKPKPS